MARLGGSRATVKALASQFAKAGTEALETPHIFNTPEVIKAGGIVALEHLFSWQVEAPSIKEQNRIASRLKTQMAAVEQARHLAIFNEAMAWQLISRNG